MADNYTPASYFKNRMRKLRISCHQYKEWQEEVKEQSDKERSFKNTSVSSETLDEIDNLFWLVSIVDQKELSKPYISPENTERENKLPRSRRWLELTAFR